MTPTRAIEVRIWGQRVGATAMDPVRGAYAFEFDRRWLASGIDLAPIQMPLATALRSPIFVFPSLPEPTYRRLPGLLSDALPDDFGNALIDAWMATHGTRKEDVTTLDRLAYMGRRGMGALEFKPVRGRQAENKAPLQMKSLVEQARKAIAGRIDDDREAAAAFAQIIQVGTSAGGARAKAVIAWNPVTQEIRSGQFDVAEGFEHWLLKFDGIGEDKELGTPRGYGRIEYAYHLMAKDAGIDMMQCRLLEENGRAHFMTRRFDRGDRNAKHHVQTLSALSHLDYRQRHTHAYEQLFQAIDRLELGPDAKAQAFRRMAFNVIARNCDDHTKNFAFMMKQGGTWEMSPAYDVTHAHNPRGEWTYQHQMSVAGRFDGIGREEMMTVADRFAVPGAKSAIDEIEETVGGWADYAEEAGVDTKIMERIREDFRLP